LRREIWFALVTLVTLATAATTLAQTPATPPPADPLALTGDDRVLGKSDAPITIVEYGSLTCPHCAVFDAEVLPKLKEKWIDSGKAKLVFRPFARDLDVDLRAASVALCVAPERFYPFIDAIFASQDQWMRASDIKAALARIALLGGVNKTTFDACWDDKTVSDRLLASRIIASQQLKVESTPTFFINGKRFDDAPTEDAFNAALTKAGS
jgi:protein-disulfide isomerase